VPRRSWERYDITDRVNGGMYRWAGLLGFAFLVGSAWGGEACEIADVQAATSPAQASTVTELLEVTGVFARARPEADRVVAQLRTENPRIPPELWSNFAERIADRDALLSVYAPIYARYLTEQVVRGAVCFYRSSAGVQLLKAMPTIQAETRSAALSWVSDIARDLIFSADQQTPSAPASLAPSPVARSKLRPGAREVRVQELLRVSGTIVQAQQMISEIIDRLQAAPQGRGLTPSMWEQARARMTNNTDLMRLWTPAYAHNLSDEEISALLKFYHSPAGRRFVVALPEIQKAALDAAVQLGRDAVKRATREVLGPLPQWTLDHRRTPTPEPPPTESAPASGSP
jgi:hypothetical protein